MKRAILLLAITVISLAVPALAATRTVTNCADSGGGSLRQALTAAGAGDVIVFDITTLEAGYSSGDTSPGLVTNEAEPNAWFRIIINSGLEVYSGDQYLQIRGSTQTREANNSLGPRVEIRITNNDHVLSVNDGNVTVEGLAINKAGGDGTFGSIGLVLNWHADHVHGCYIGTTATGDAVSPTTLGYGIAIVANNNHLIGGTTEAERNVISGLYSNGIQIVTDSRNNRIIGNYIGTNRTGTAALANQNGIYILSSPLNYIGGSAEGERNVISGNTADGISLASPSIEVKGNYIGTTASGEAPLANQSCGVNIGSGAHNCLIGGPGSLEGNLISGNGLAGVNIASSDRNNIFSNIIGLNKDGSTLLGNGGDGVYVGSSAGTVIGWTGYGSNVISGNTGYGIQLVTATASQIYGNQIGVDSGGSSDRGNQQSGIVVNGGGSNVIGLSTSGRNIVSGNTVNGITITNSPSNEVYGNYIGTNAAGTGALGNDQHGIEITSAAQFNKIGSTTSQNVISGNGRSGIRISVFGTNSNEVVGNFVGLDKNGTAKLGNQNHGILITDNAYYNRIGDGTANGRNVISGNSYAGVAIFLQAHNNRLDNNSIGSDVLGNDAYGNTLEGVVIGSPVDYVRSTLVANNAIRYNGNAAAPGGIIVQHNDSKYNRFSRNIMRNNYGLGIILNDGSNNGIPAPTVTSAIDLLYDPGDDGGEIIVTDVLLSGEALPGASVEVFSAGIIGDGLSGEARKYLDTTTADGSGHWTIYRTGQGVLFHNYLVTATQTDAGNNTSMFSYNVTVEALSPVTTTTTLPTTSTTTTTITTTSTTTTTTTTTVTLPPDKEIGDVKTDIETPIDPAAPSTINFDFLARETLVGRLMIVKKGVPVEVLLDEPINISAGRNLVPVTLVSKLGKKLAAGDYSWSLMVKGKKAGSGRFLAP